MRKQEWDVGVDGDVLHVLADRWFVSANGLRFWQGETIIAWFVKWDWFVVVDVGDETQSKQEDKL